MEETPYQPTDRRPIAARGWPIWQRTAIWLAKRGVSANAISVAGMVCGVFAGALLLATSEPSSIAEPVFVRILFVGAALFIQLRLLANLLDGMVAIESGKASKVGELYNEIPDRVSDAATLIGAGYALGGDIILGFAAAIAAIFTAYIRAIGKAAGAANEYCGPMAKQQRMALMTAVAVYCAIAPSAWRSISLAERQVGVIAIALAIIIAGCLITVARRLSRIVATLQKGPR